MPSDVRGLALGKKIMESEISKIHSMTLPLQWIFRKMCFYKVN